MRGLSVQEAASLVGGRLLDEAVPKSVYLSDVCSIDEAGPEHITFLERESLAPTLSTSLAGAVLVSPAVAKAATGTHPPLIVVDDPLGAFIQAMLQFRPRAPRPCAGISDKALISPSAKLGRDAIVQPGAYIGPDVVIGERCLIHVGAVIQAGCQLGDDVTIHPNAVLYPQVTLGHRVIIHATCVLGADGFGYRFREGRFEHIPHTGTVRIEDDVEIGAGTTIDRAMIGATVIGEGSKIDNQVMIGHNCRIGRHNAFASQAGLAGSVVTGDYVRLGGQVGIADHSHLGTGCSLGAKAGVRGSIPAGEDYHGYPAQPAKEAYKVALSAQKVPEMRKQLRDLHKDIQELRAEVARLSGASPSSRSAA